MDKIIGFIGSGNMGKAIIGGIIKGGIASAGQIWAADVSEKALDSLHSEYGIHVTADNLKAAQMSDILFLAVKPNIYPAVIDQIKDTIKDNVIIITIAAGQKLEKIEALFDRAVKVIRTMPNTPALVGEGMTAVCPNSRVSTAELEELHQIFSCFGRAETVPESLMDIVTGISGSSPAYVYMFIEAMADAAVANGMARAQAYTFAAQAVMGSAKMVLETGIHPGQLKDNVCSPGGTTIAAVCELENKGMRNAVISAIQACTDKSRDMGK